MECTICREAMVLPQMTLCGHGYCLLCIGHWVLAHKSCPKCSAQCDTLIDAFDFYSVEDRSREFTEEEKAMKKSLEPFRHKREESKKNVRFNFDELHRFWNSQTDLLPPRPEVMGILLGSTSIPDTIIRAVMHDDVLVDNPQRNGREMQSFIQQILGLDGMIEGVLMREVTIPPTENVEMQQERPSEGSAAPNPGETPAPNPPVFRVSFQGMGVMPGSIAGNIIGDSFGSLSALLTPALRELGPISQETMNEGIRAMGIETSSPLSQLMMGMMGNMLQPPTVAHPNNPVPEPDVDVD